MPTANPSADKRGFKRICTSCSTRFYDFNKRPIICPNCDTEFTGDIKVKVRRARIVSDDVEDQVAKTPVDEVEEDDVVIEDTETVSLDEVEEDDVADDEEETLDADLDLDEDLDDDLDDDDDDDDDEEDEDDDK